MRKSFRRILIPLSIVTAATLPLTLHSKTIDFEFTPDQSKTAVDIIDKLSSRHYRGQPFDDQLSRDMLQKYVSNLDPGKSYFLQSDIDRFEKAYATHLDDAMRKGDLKPGQDIFQTYHNRASDRLIWIIKQLENKEASLFDFSLNEEIPIKEELLQWSTNPAQADDNWRKRLKSNLLSLKLSGDTPDEAAEKLLKRYRNQTTRLAQQDADDAFEVMVNAMTTLYDPHTSYLSPRTQENFNISMSLSLEGIGAVLQTEDEHTKVVRLISGGPAFKQGQLKPADKIVAVSQGADGEWVDVVGWRLDEVVKLIRGPKNTKVRLSVIPSDAADDSVREEIQISRAKVKLEEQAAKKGVLQLTDGEQLFKIGVINVPTFYLDFEAYRRRDPNAKSTTGDVIRLLRELDEENVDGLIIDLRNNGGGSLQEATTLTDLFIDRGPVVQIRQTNETISRHFRSRRPALYRGPLVVLTNRLSASASEIFAGAIQDYHRGLIVGSQSFGKGTVQSLTPVHQGQLKITESKFYRVSGDSTQHRGVVPDIEFPFLVDSEEVGESSYETALPWDQIHEVSHDSYYNFDKFVHQLKKNHEGRKAEDPDFIYLSEQVESVKKNRKRTHISLNENKRLQEQNQRKAETLTLENNVAWPKGLNLSPILTHWKKTASKSETPS